MAIDEKPQIPESETLSDMSDRILFELSERIRAYLIEVLICRPDINQQALLELPRHGDIAEWIREYDIQINERGSMRNDQTWSLVRKEVGGPLLLRVSIQYQEDRYYAMNESFGKMDWKFCDTPRKKHALKDLLAGKVSLKGKLGHLFEILWDFPNGGYYINTPDEIILREALVPGSYRVLLELAKRRNIGNVVE